MGYFLRFLVIAKLPNDQNSIYNHYTRRAKHSSKPLAAKPHGQHGLSGFFEPCFHGANMYSLPFAWENIYSQNFLIWCRGIMACLRHPPSGTQRLLL